MFDKVCERALREAELMAQVHRDIFNKDCVAQVYGVAKGVPPSQLHGLALCVEGEECVAIIMRLETGGSLENWLYGQARGAGIGSGGAARTIEERLRMAAEVARGALSDYINHSFLF